MTTTLLIDGDIYVYQAAVCHEYVTQWDPWLWTRHADFQPAAAQLDELIDTVVEELEADDCIIALSDDTNFRRELYPDVYKFKRQATPKPVIYQPLRSYLHETRTVFQRARLEGDDVLGILATHPKLVAGRKIIVSIDKDFNTIPCEWYRPGDGLLRTSLRQADHYHMRQTLMGDTVDGYKGCPGVGSITAEKMLGTMGTYEEMWPVVLGAFEKKKLGVEVAMMNARLARILRAEDYDISTKEIKLWDPPEV